MWGGGLFLDISADGGFLSLFFNPARPLDGKASSTHTYLHHRMGPGDHGSPRRPGAGTCGVICVMRCACFCTPAWDALLTPAWRESSALPGRTPGFSSSLLILLALFLLFFLVYVCVCVCMCGSVCGCVYVWECVCMCGSVCRALLFKSSS